MYPRRIRCTFHGTESVRQCPLGDSVCLSLTAALGAPKGLCAVELPALVLPLLYRFSTQVRCQVGGDAHGRQHESLNGKNALGQWVSRPVVGFPAPLPRQLNSFT